MFKLQCSKCGYVKTYFENEIIKDEKCELCNNRMVLPKKEIKNVVKHDSILKMEQQIKQLGHAKVWEVIEQLPVLKTRLAYRKLFFEAGGIVPKSNL